MQYLDKCPPWVAVIFAIASLGIVIWTKLNDSKHFKDWLTRIEKVTKELKKEQEKQGNRLTTVEVILKERK